MKPLAAVAILAWVASPAPAAERVEANRPFEFVFAAAREHADPFNAVTLDVRFTDPRGQTRRVPAFWAGGKTWKVRYSSPVVGTHRFVSECSAASDAGLHGVRGAVEVVPYEGDNPLYKHGPVRVAANRRHFEHADGTPFLWLGDTQWMGLCRRLRWPDEFKRLAADRKAKGFNVVQIVAGLYPDMPAFDPRGANEAGFPWTKDYGTIRPEYFDHADRRVFHLAEEGIAPCIVGAWGYHLPWMGEQKMKRHWRYLIARYGALPVFWCVAGEANLPYYLTEGFPYEDREQVRRWTEVARYVREIEPFGRPISIHPTGLGSLSSRGAIGDIALIDFDMQQTGHGDLASLGPTVTTLRRSYAAKPTMPVLNSEVCYEGILGRCGASVQRVMVWACLLSGAAGHTYGANGIWQVNRSDQPYGKSPHGADYGSTPWDEAMRLPGSAQVGHAGKLLRSLPWHRFEPHPEWAEYAPPTPVELGKWIWSPERDAREDAAVAARYFRAAFELPKDRKVARAALVIGCDDRSSVWLNGEPVGEVLG
ncbi:MAG TPA: DUF4038 domain-containing protein, partial [Gemmataceae bacterium]